MGRRASASVWNQWTFKHSPRNDPRASARRRAFGNSSSPTSATRTRAAPTAARSGNSSHGASSAAVRGRDAHYRRAIVAWPAHKVAGARVIIEKAGAKLLYLPPYSADLNPIEMMFAKLNALLRNAKERTVDKPWDRIGVVLDEFTPSTTPLDPFTPIPLGREPAPIALLSNKHYRLP